MSVIRSFREWLGRMFAKYDEYKKNEVNRLDEQIKKETRKVELEKKRQQLRKLKEKDSEDSGILGDNFGWSY